MFETQTYDKLMEEVLAAAPPGIDTRKGSIFFDAISAVVNKIAKMYTDLDLIFEMVFITTTSGEYLDLKADEYAMQRQAATPAKYRLEYTGTRPASGERFFHNDSGYYFLLHEDDDGTLYLEAEATGTEVNDIEAGDIAVPVNTITGLTSAFFGAAYEYGTDAETDESLRERMLDKVAGPAENGNKQHYQSWCESITGVGRARITPLWNGENTVKAVLISPLGLPVSEAVEEAVQQYIDPNSLGKTVTVGGKTYNVGDGLGNGVANIGAHFTAAAATAHTIDLGFGAELVEGVSVEEATAAATEAVTEYFKRLVLEAGDDDQIIVRINAVGAILAGLMSYIIDYSELFMNGDEVNITLGKDEVPVMGEVIINVIS